jgi:hypothetical protein
MPKLADLGLAKQLSSADRSSLTSSGAALGTPYYIAPEQAQDATNVDVRSDIYGLGATFFRMVTGDVPFYADSPLEIMMAHCNEPLPDPQSLNRDIPDNVSAIICKMMEKEPAKRYQTAQELLQDLNAVRWQNAPVETLLAGAGRKKKSKKGSTRRDLKVPSPPTADVGGGFDGKTAVVGVALIVVLVAGAVLIGQRWAPAAPVVEVSTLNSAWKSVFDGASLDGWTGDVDGYSAAGGVLTCSEAGGNLFLIEKCSDFDFRFEFRGTEAESGVALRAPDNQSGIEFSGMEIQLITDDLATSLGLPDHQQHGSLVGVASAETGFLKADGEWNEQVISCRGRQLTVTVNKHVVLDVDLDAVEIHDGQPHPGLYSSSGHVGFVGATKMMEFRNIEIRR